MLIFLDSPTELSPGQQRMLEAFTDLKDVKLRQKWETTEGIYLAESHSVVERAIMAGHVPEAFLLTPAWLEKLRPLLLSVTGEADGGETPVFLIDEASSADITGFRVHRGALAAFRRPAPTDPVELLRSLAVPDAVPRPRSVAVLEGLVDHTNVGAIFRSAAALGIDAILLSPSCADPLYRRSIRVSMGAVFQIPWARLRSWPNLDLLRNAGYVTCALTPAADSHRLEDFIEAKTSAGDSDNLALYLGSEGPGLTRSVLSQVDARVQIPLAESIDSLNVSTAAAIAFWEARRYTGAT